MLVLTNESHNLRLVASVGGARPLRSVSRGSLSAHSAADAKVSGPVQVGEGYAVQGITGLVVSTGDTFMSACGKKDPMFVEDIDGMGEGAAAGV